MTCIILFSYHTIYCIYEIKTQHFNLLSILHFSVLYCINVLTVQQFYPIAIYDYDYSALEQSTSFWCFQSPFELIQPLACQFIMINPCISRQRHCHGGRCLRFPSWLWLDRANSQDGGLRMGQYGCKVAYARITKIDDTATKEMSTVIQVYR